MKLFSRALRYSLLSSLLLLGACEDPLDRMQGEPGEDGAVSTAVEESGTGVRLPDDVNGASGGSGAPTDETEGH